MPIKNGDGVKLVKALETAWVAVQQACPELPDVVFITGSGVQPRSLRLGHYWHEQWKDGDKVKKSELFIAGETIHMGTEQVLSTMLHEACHALARVRGVKDVGKDGRKHLVGFRDLAIELGLDVVKSDSLGWSHTTLTEETREAYAPVLARLEKDLEMFRTAPGWVMDPETGKTTKKEGVDSEGQPTKPKADRNYHKAVCGCGTVIRASKTVLEALTVECSECGEAFKA